jgi:hypothetical protein
MLLKSEYLLYFQVTKVKAAAGSQTQGLNAGG